MKPVKRSILNLLLFGAVFSNISAQNSYTDSLRILFREIVTVSNDNISSCKKFGEYKSTISQISLDNPEDAVSAIIFADSLFLKANKNNSCALVKPVSHLQAILHKLKNETLEDTLSLTQALLFYKSKFSGLVNVKLNFNPNLNPSVSVQGFDLFILPLQPDSSAAEVYLLPEKKYYLTVSLSGYNSFTTQILTTKDTVISVNLNEIKVTNEQPAQKSLNNKRSISLWWIPIALILIIFIALAWRTFKNKKPEISSPKENSFYDEISVKDLNEKLQNQEVLINKYRSEIEVLNLNQPHHHEKRTSGYFISEMMMTAGPRKKMNVDKDLGEDVCGFVMNDTEALVWLMDGSSDFFDPLLNPDNKREYFSSRLLAQSLGRKLRLLFTSGKAASLDTGFENIIKEVKEEWLFTINSLPESEKNILRKNLKDGIEPDCASTVLIAHLTIGGDLKVYRTGDSKLLSYTVNGEHMNVDISLASKNDKIGPVSFLLCLNQNNIDINVRQSKPEITKRTNIHSVIGYSDGIGKATEKALIKEYPMNIEKARNEIITQLQGTGDDKSIFILEIKEDK